MASRLRPSKPTGLWKVWDKVVRRAPRAVALIEAESGKSWTREDLFARARELAAGPLAHATGNNVGYSLPNNSQWMILFTALQAVGAAAVPLDSSLTAKQQDALAASAGLRYVWRDGELMETHGTVTSIGKMRVGKLTSGTTGNPRIIRCTADHLIADGRNIIRTMGLRPNDRNLALIPLGHSYGLGNLVIPLLLQGTSLVCARAFVPRQIPHWIQKHRVTLLAVVPAIVRLLAELPGRDRLPKLRLVISAGARLPAESALAFKARWKRRVHNFYGSSETGGICYDKSGAASTTGRAVGVPLKGVEVDLTARGRVRVTSEAVASGRRGIFTLPDIGRFNSRGELELIGRLGRVANLGGRNLHPREIENRLVKLRGVTDAWVQALSEAGRDYLVAAVESTRSVKEISAELSAAIAEWQQPRFWLVRPRLPRNARGKLDHEAIKSQFASANSIPTPGRG